MKRILLICNYFAPENEIASIRLTKFAKYLRKYGYDVHVLTEKKDLNMEDDILKNDVEGIPVTYVENSSWIRSLDDWYARITKKYREKKYNDVTSRMRYSKKAKAVMFYPFEKMYPVIGTIDMLFKMIKNHNLSKNARKYLRKNSQEIDVCFSTYGNYFGHFAGHYLKKCNSKIRWIADFRDPVHQFMFDPIFFVPIAVLYEWWSWARCDEIVVISKGMKKRIPACFRKKTHCITNGYDKEDREYLMPSNRTPKFTICYTGRMYGGMRDVSKIFQVVRQLIDERIVEKDNFEFRYAGTGFQVFLSQAEQYHLGELCIDYGNVSRKQALQIQADSTMLLMTTWDYKCQTLGVLTGKVLEYMLQEKPIIAIINGDVPDNELAHIIADTGMGVAYQQIHDQRDTVALKHYIKKQYSLYCEGKDLDFHLDRKKLKKYEYPYLTKKLIHVIEREKA